MAIKKIFDRNGFVSVFNTDNGDYMRTSILSKEGIDTGIEGFQAEFPQLLDIGIMGHCIHGLSGKCSEIGTECYQSGSKVNMPNMSLENYEKLIKQCEDRTFQVALGGRGDPDQHENFEDILRITKKHGIVPNITTSGYGLTKRHVRLIKEHCGAAAVSYYKTAYMYKAIEMLSSEGVITNLHFVLGNNNIQEAIEMLSNNKIPDGIDRIIFLLHKPIGMGSMDRMLKRKDPLVKDFFKLLSSTDIVERTGFDSCCVPAIIEYCKEISSESFDACESGRFSAYIDAQLNMSPCSFDKTNHVSINLNHYTIDEAWNSEAFQSFRKRFMKACIGCNNRSICLGGCPVCSDINLCENYEAYNKLSI